MMPKMNGFEVCQIVKQDADTQEIHIIMLTAKGQEFDQQKGREVGANLYMTKPFDPDEIVRQASEVLGLV
jgi:two-component system, OmpR family, alkaline phosphatase synthesis response regulator PhoP